MHNEWWNQLGSTSYSCGRSWLSLIVFILGDCAFIDHSIIYYLVFPTVLGCFNTINQIFAERNEDIMEYIRRESVRAEYMVLLNSAEAQPLVNGKGGGGLTLSL
jgi:hypothetical protein